MDNEIRIIPADDPQKTRINWTIEEKIGPCYLPSDDNSCYETNKADEFLGSHGKSVDEIEKGLYVWNVVPQLQFLWGQPWNNLALNYVMGLRPSSIRVSTGTLTCDSFTWRITIILEKDNRTIKRIEQECNVGSIGAECGHDLKLKLKQQETGQKIPKFDITKMYVNSEALEKIKIEEK